MITARVPQQPHDRGYAAAREEAMMAFKAAWSADDAHALRFGTLDVNLRTPAVQQGESLIISRRSRSADAIKHKKPEG